MPLGRSSLIAAIPAVAVALGVFLLFPDKAFNIDDLTFLLEAQHMLRDSWHPTAFEMVFHGVSRWESAGMVSGPVMPLMLIPSLLAGGSEVWAHVVAVTVFVVGLAATAALALRLGLSRTAAAWAALLVATSPGVVGMALTSMPDVPAMAFAALGAERLHAWRDDRRPLTAAASALALALATLSRPHALLVLPCLVPLLLTDGEKLLDALRTRSFLLRVLPLGGALATFACVGYALRDGEHGHNLAGSTLREMNAARLWLNLANIPTQWVLAFPLGVVWVARHGRRMARYWWCGAAALLGAALALLTQATYNQPSWLVWQVPVAALGTAVLTDILVNAWRRRDHVELGLGAWLLIAAPTVFYYHLPPKYLVPSTPAMAILLLRHLAGMERKLAGVLLSLTAAAGLAVGLLVVDADAALSALGRHGGRDTVADLVDRGERVWLDGAWGFQWYAQQAGARPMTVGPPFPAPGDVVVTGIESGRIEQLPRRRLLQRYVVAEPGGRVCGPGTGFFTNVTGVLPWTWSSRELGRIEVWRIER